MSLEEQRAIHEDLERLEQAISDRLQLEPRNIREQLSRDHQIANFLTRIEDQSSRLLELYNDDGARTQEIQSLATGDPFDMFYKQLGAISEHHRKYPNEPVENLERAYRRKPPGEESTGDIDNMFTGEEGFGRYLDLNDFHNRYLNLPGIRGGKRINYIQYIDNFDVFTPPQCPVKPHDKIGEEYFSYVSDLMAYLESFLRRTRPLHNHERNFAEIDEEFEQAWTSKTVPGWEAGSAKIANGSNTQTAEGTGSGVWCPDCEKEFGSEGSYKGHLTGKKHIRNVEAKKTTGEKTNGAAGTPVPSSSGTKQLKEKVVAGKEFRIRKLAGMMQTERSDTKVNVERRQGMTEREREQEIEAIYAESAEPQGRKTKDASDDEEDDKIHNPLHLPLAWDGKPIPFWLYKLHGLGVEFSCEICGNYTYMGRRAFDKHFGEARHTYGLKCLGIQNGPLLRDVTTIKDALALWEKLQEEKKKDKVEVQQDAEMEDSMGNVMPSRVFYDLQKQGLL